MTTTTTAALIDTLAALSTDRVTVTAIERDGKIIPEYTAHSDDDCDAESICEQVSREIGAILRAAGCEFTMNAGSDGGGAIYEVWTLGECPFVVEGCGADQTLTAVSAEAAAQEAAEWQHGDDGAHTVTLTWRDAGSDSTTIAVYDCKVDGESVGRVTVRRG